MGHHHKKSSRRDYPPEPMQNPNPPNPLGNIDIGSIANLLGSLDLSRLTSLLGNIDMGQVSSMLSKMNQSPQSNPKPAPPPQEGSFTNPNSNTGNNDNNNNPLGNINTNDLNNMLKNIDMNQVSSMVSQMTGGGGLGGLPLDMGKPKAGDYRIGVLNSLKPFLPEDKCNMIDEIVKYLTLKTAIDKVKGSKSKS